MVEPITERVGVEEVTGGVVVAEEEASSEVSRDTEVRTMCGTW